VTASGGFGNLFAGLPASLRAEQVDVLAEANNLRIERIVSRGQVTPPGEWYDGDRDEWVAVLAGAARLRFEGEPAPRALAPGDWLRIPAHARHRVEWTDPERATVWLAVHFAAGD
jgi:cupin 2 domain-containing protein